jgi:hypothetical protein
MRLAAHNQLTLVAVAAGPAGEPVVDHLLGQLVELGLRLGARLLKLRLRFGERLAAHAGVEKVRRLGQRRRRKSDGNGRMRFST